ncbi:MAG: DUF4440 domain-containing protein [Thermosynechococcaceae cyanobacterium]
MQLTQADIAQLQELEESLWRSETRFDLSFMDQTLAPDFFEFGRSGRVYSRDETLSVPFQAIHATLPLIDFQICLLDTDVALVTYRSKVNYSGVVEQGRRSSIWSRATTGWILRFHQGTPNPDSCL